MHWVLRSRKTLFLCGILGTLVVSLLALFPPYPLQLLDSRVYDFLLNTLPESPEKGLPVIVDIDDKTMAEFGHWPWPRYKVAGFLDAVREQGPAAVGIDFIFSEPDRASLKVLKQNFFSDLGISLELDGIPARLRDNDMILAETLSGGPFVLGYMFSFQKTEHESSQCQLNRPQMVWRLDPDMKAGERNLVRARQVDCSLDTLSSEVKISGFVNAIPDRDGILRKVPTVAAYNGISYPCFGVAVLMRAIQADWLVLRATPDGMDWVRMMDISIPVDSMGNLMLRYHRDPDYFEKISAGDILSGRISKNKLRDRIVLVGSTAGELKDHLSTPFNSAYPGIQVHALLIDNILKREFLFRPYWANGVEYIFIWVCGLLATLLLTRTRSLWSGVIIICGAAGIWQEAVWVLRSDGFVLSPTYPILALAGISPFMIIFKYWLEEVKVREQTLELARTESATIAAMASVIETRDSETGSHIKRTQHYVKILAEYLKDQSSFAKHMDKETIQLLFLSSPLHDIGKVGVPDRILQKPGKLTFEEFEEMKMHTLYGMQILSTAEKELGSNSFLRIAKDIAYTHHEKWDGTGYPRRLKGREIPLAGRLMAVADVYDALTSRRVYKSKMGYEEAMRIIADARGTGFDPDVVDAFLANEVIFREIAMEHEEEFADEYL